jgi:hypothetical protein
MEQDTPAAVHEPQNKEEETHQEIPPEHTEATMEVNRMTQHLGEEEKPDEMQAPDLGHPAEETAGTTWAWPEWMTRGTTRSCWNFEPANTAGGPSSDTKLTSKETGCRDCATSHTRGSTGGPTTIGSRRKLKYSNHDVADETKYPELAPQVFMQKIVVNQLGETITQPHQWATGLDRTRILGLLKIPHFGRGQYASACIKKLLAVTHGGDVWLDKPIPIIVELITQITGLPTWGMDPALILDDKSKEKTLAEEMKKKYGTDRGTRGIIIKQSTMSTTQLGAKILACKLLRKCRKDKVPVGVIVVAAQCTEGTSMSWAPYLSNLFQVDCKDTQDAGTNFITHG